MDAASDACYGEGPGRGDRGGWEAAEEGEGRRAGAGEEEAQNYGLEETTAAAAEAEAEAEAEGDCNRNTAKKGNTGGGEEAEAGDRHTAAGCAAGRRTDWGIGRAGRRRCTRRKGIRRAAGRAAGCGKGWGLDLEEEEDVGRAGRMPFRRSEPDYKVCGLIRRSGRRDLEELDRRKMIGD